MDAAASVEERNVALLDGVRRELRALLLELEANAQPPVAAALSRVLELVASCVAGIG